MITGDKTILRAIEPSDVKRLWEWSLDEEAIRLRDYPSPPVSLAETEKQYTDGLPSSPDHIHLAVTTRDGKLIGETSLLHIDHRIGDAELTIAIGDKAYWGRGYGTDATRTFCRYAFHQLNLHRITLYVHDFNPRAIRAYEKCGFREEGRLREAEYLDGRYSDIVIMGLLRDEVTSNQ